MSPRRHDDERIYNRLAVLRAERGLSRQDLAATLGIHYQTIGYLERGDYNPSLQLALKLAAFFALPVEAIFSLTPFALLSEQVYLRPTSPPPAPPKQEVTDHA
jgi:putative transcriptional regulator